MAERKDATDGLAPFARVAIKGALVRQPELVDLPRARTCMCKADIKVGEDIFRDVEARGATAKRLNAALANSVVLVLAKLSTVTWKTEDQVEHYKLRIEADSVRVYKRLAVEP
jgi:hypothetical protein